jgi:cytidyltransferase-like protein
MKRIVVVAGGYDPIHDGHRSNMAEAKKLGDLLVVIVHPDRIMVKKKGFCYQPLRERIKALYKEECVDAVMISIDDDGTVAKTLEMIRPHFFCKGGDRAPDQHALPQSEIDVCEKIGCQIVYGVGEPKRPEWSSTLIGRRALGLDKPQQ